MNKAFQLQQKSYYLRSLILWLCIFYFVLALVSTLYLGYKWLVRGMPSAMISTFFGIAIVAFIFFAIVVLQKIRIEVPHEGVVFSSLGFCMYTPWSNIASIQAIKHPYFPTFLFPVPVFVLKEPAIRHVSLREGKQRGVAVIEADWAIFFAEPASYSWYFPLPQNMIRSQEWDTGVFDTIGVKLRMAGLIEQVPQPETWLASQADPAVPPLADNPGKQNLDDVGSFADPPGTNTHGKPFRNKLILA